ncbi:MAG: PEP-CTERM sorting domain-containing protein [Candidatus Brocadiia bacterium]
MRKACVAFVMLTVLATSASAVPLVVGDAYLSYTAGGNVGWRAIGGDQSMQGLDAEPADGSWKSEEGFRIWWDIKKPDLGQPISSTNYWEYNYCFTTNTLETGTGEAPGDFLTLSDAPTGGELSNWLLEVSPFITSENLESLIFDINFSIEYDDGLPEDPRDFDVDTNTGTVSIYGMKLEPLTAGQHFFSFASLQQPVWSDFFAKDGAVGRTAWNIGIGSDPALSDSPFTNWVPGPDTEGGAPPQTVIPEPSTLILLGLALVGVASAKRHHS